MTAPNVGQSPTQRLFQTIVTLKELRQRDEAAQLAREQFGLEQAKFGLNQAQDVRQAGQVQEAGLAALQAIRSNVTDPSVLLPHTDVFSQMTGLPSDVVTSIIQGTPTSESTTRNTAVASGAKQLAGSLDTEAASSALTGANLGANVGSGLHAEIYAGAQHFLSQLTPEQRMQFNQRVLERTGSGMSPEEATMSTLFDNAPRVDQIRAMQVAKGLAPSASADQQASIANRQLALDYSRQAFEESARTMQLDISRAEAEARVHGKDPETAKKVIDLLDLYNKSLQAFGKGSTTMTKTGIISTAQGINSIVDELQKLAPDQYPQPVVDRLKIPIGEAPGSQSGFLQWMSQKGLVP